MEITEEKNSHLVNLKNKKLTNKKQIKSVEFTPMTNDQ